MRNRPYLDLPADRSSFDGEVLRLEGLGAQRVDVGQGADVSVVFANPEGHKFCLLRRTMQEVMDERA